jgi:dinuclear metal center YbgI/SA1388 family protein
VAYHLPLDAHPKFGNNVQLAQRLGWEVDDQFGKYGLRGYLPHALASDELTQQIATVLGRQPLVIAPRQPKTINTLAWCSGAAQGYIEMAADAGLDAYLSGEVSEHSYHVARERGIYYFACGHHATERYGVMALGEYLAQQFDVEFAFFDSENPV